METVFVVIGLDLGWDNIVGVFSKEKITLEELQNEFPKGEYHIFSRNVEHDLSEYRF